MARGGPRLPFLFNATAPTEIYTLSLHDALPISGAAPVPQDELPEIPCGEAPERDADACRPDQHAEAPQDRKSTRLNSSHLGISYAVFCLKKKTHRRCL